MYLARKQIRGRTRYYIRESIAAGKGMKSRELFDLGHDPAGYIIYPDDGVAFYFDPRLIESLESMGVAADSHVLEKMFFPFLRPESRRVIEMFSRPPGRLREQVRRCEIENFHIFDRRRMHFLKFGEIDQSRISIVPTKIYRKLLDKSRDEIEQQFMRMELVLDETEKKNYTYAAFNVTGHFTSDLARKFPQALPRQKVDAAFMEELCRINADAGFWADLGVSDRLNDYLVRYACWFFDTEFSGSAYLEDLVWQFKRRYHGFAPKPRAAMSLSEAVSAMGITQQELSGMTIRALTRQYRKMAHKHHPDKGGDHEKFIRLNRAFEDLLKKVKNQGRTGPRYTTRRS